MELTFTGRGLAVTDEMREIAHQKLDRLGRLEPRTMRIDIEIITEHHPTLDGMKRVEAAMRVPRKTFRARAEAPEVAPCLDALAEKLERQIRDHHGRRRTRFLRHRRSLKAVAVPTDTPE